MIGRETASKPQGQPKGPTSSCKASPKDFISGQMFRHMRLRETFHIQITAGSKGPQEG